MNFLKLLILIILFPFILLANNDRPPIKYNYLSKSNVQYFIRMMHNRYGFETNYLRQVLKQAKLDRDTLARYTGKFKKNSTVGSWERFKLHVVNEETFNEARKFKKHYKNVLKKAERIYKVDMNYIVGFLGVESRFGTYTGDYSVLDALSTLAFHPNRMQKFFKNELKHLFLFAREKGYNIKKLEGSFAGAMGCVQQVPSIARKHKSDFNNDGKTDPWDLEDCIGSIAKFMHKNGWKNGRVVAIATKFKGTRFKKLKTSHKRTLSVETIYHAGIKPLKPYNESRAYLLKTRNTTHDDIYMGGRNFRVLTKYNNSTSYGVAIHLIAKAIK